jgi:hypothetical protein
MCTSWSDCMIWFSSWIQFFTSQYMWNEYALSFILPWAPHIAIIRSRMWKCNFNALARTYTHWVIWENQMRKLSKVCFENLWQKPQVTWHDEHKWFDSWPFHSSATQDGMIDTPQSSQVQGMVLNISYARFIPMDVMSHLICSPFTRDEQRSTVGELLTVVKYHF